MGRTRFVFSALSASLTYLFYAEFSKPDFANWFQHFLNIWSFWQFYVIMLWLAVPYMFYAYIWNFTSHYVSQIQSGIFKGLGKDGAEVKHHVVMMTKLAQFTTVFGLYFLYEDRLYYPGLNRLLLGCFFIACGQVLNFAVYNALGADGVCYGFLFGKDIPWVTGFPFNIGIRHPQYVGAVISLWGFFMIFVTPKTLGPSIAGALLISVYYTLIGKMEEGEASGGTEKKD